MDEIKWLEVAVNTTPDKLDQVCARLAAAGMDSVVIEDEQEFLTFLEQNRQYWDYVDEELDRSMAGKCRVTFYVEENEPGFAQAAAVRIAMAELKKDHPECAPLLMTVDGLEDEDWENNW